MTKKTTDQDGEWIEQLRTYLQESFRSGAITAGEAELASGAYIPTLDEVMEEVSDGTGDSRGNALDDGDVHGERDEDGGADVAPSDS